MFKHNFSGRYSDILEELLMDLKAVEVLKESFEDDYQGFIDVDVLLEDGRVFSYCYSYGSCAGCDEWESLDLDEKQIKEDMKQGSAIFDNIDEYKKWDEMRNKSNQQIDTTKCQQIDTTKWEL